MIQLLHGDCLELMATLPDVDAIVCDPPYGDDHDTDYTRFTGGAGVPRSRHARIAGDKEPYNPQPLLDLNKPTVVFGANRFSDKLPCGSWFVWDKRTPNGNKNVMSDAEVAWYSKGRGVYIFQHTWDGFNRASERRTNYHPTQKPVALMEWIIQRLKLPQGATVLDPYMGSGPVGVACVNLGYNYIGIERDPAYFAIAQQRIAAAQQTPQQLLLAS